MRPGRAIATVTTPRAASAWVGSRTDPPGPTPSLGVIVFASSWALHQRESAGSIAPERKRLATRITLATMSRRLSARSSFSTSEEKRTIRPLRPSFTIFSTATRPCSDASLAFIFRRRSQRGICSSICTPCEQTCLTTSRISSVRPGTSSILVASK